MNAGHDFSASGRDDLKRLTELVGSAMEDEPPAPTGKKGLFAFFERFGRQIVSLGADAYAMQVFSGQLIVAAARTLFHPRRLRLTPTVERKSVGSGKSGCVRVDTSGSPN